MAFVFVSTAESGLAAAQETPNSIRIHIPEVLDREIRPAGALASTAGNIPHPRTTRVAIAETRIDNRPARSGCLGRSHDQGLDAWTAEIPDEAH